MFTQFIEDIASEVINNPDDYSPEDAERYLNLVRKTLGGGGECGTGGLLLSVSPNGAINYIVLKDIMDLRMNYERWRDSLQQEWREVDIKQQHTISHKRRLERDGPDFEM
ncbi:hypothetical protein [Providencia sp.]|uniref:hypothetical protein n=1 Tax=Providencia sp. TaxID=589 RepID=UPI00333FB225